MPQEKWGKLFLMKTIRLGSFMRFLFVTLVGLLVILFVACQPIIDAINVQSVLTSQSASQVGYDAPSKLLTILKNNPKDENAWKALHHYRSLTDAGLTLTFYRDCFNALKEKPLLFFDRYMAGDEQALFRMVDALSHDFSAFTGETFRATNQVFKRSLDNISDFQTTHSQDKEVYRRGYDFRRVSRSQYDSWRLRYCEFTRENSEAVAQNCASWQS
jgi:hypothetical protein